MWKNTVEANALLYKLFTDATNRNPMLKMHRDFIEDNNYGFGERAFHFLWYVLIMIMPTRFKCLEIGVYKGQITTLIQIIARVLQKKCDMIVVSPFSSSADKYSVYAEEDYFGAFIALHQMFNLDPHYVGIVKSFSHSPFTSETLAGKTFDLIYIDGSHDYDVVCKDIELCKGLLKVNGYLVMDDASYFLNMPETLFSGHREVGLAVQKHLEDDDNYKHVIAIGHNRIFRKIK